MGKDVDLAHQPPTVPFLRIAQKWDSTPPKAMRLISAIVQEGSEASSDRRFISIWPRRIEHQSLCSATGMPHSTQTRTRGFGGSSRPSNRFRNDIGLPPSPTKVNTLDEGNRFTVGFGAGPLGHGIAVRIFLWPGFHDRGGTHAALRTARRRGKPRLRVLVAAGAGP